jgi:ubiquinone/menaquinone biosynthesis C-methylase UbiE
MRSLAQGEEYVSEENFGDYVNNLDGLRGRIVEKLPFERRMRVLDNATGVGYFAIELARRDPTLKVVAIDISDRAIRGAERRVKEKWLDSSVTVMNMDATHLNFQPSTFGLVTDFMGLDDMHMTRGQKGVRQFIQEAARVLKPRGYLCFTIIPPEEAETQAQWLECEVYSYACGLTWLPMIKYQEFLRGTGFTLLKKETFYTGKKLTATQAKQQLDSAIEKAVNLGVDTLPIDEVWKKYGAEIEREGLGHCSKGVLMIARKNA